MHELLLSYKNNNVLLDVIKKQSKEEKFTCPNCREEFLGIIPVCRLTEYLRAQSIQKGEVSSQLTCCQLLANSEEVGTFYSVV